MDLKLGGRRRRGPTTYEARVRRSNRPWPMPRADGDCNLRYKLVHSSFEIHGRGWSTWDHGQDSLLPAIKGCLRPDVTSWKFEYYDEPQNGMEWRASFKAPIWVNARCFASNKAAFGTGGFHNGSSGSG